MYSPKIKHFLDYQSGDGGQLKLTHLYSIFYTFMLFLVFDCIFIGPIFAFSLADQTISLLYLWLHISRAAAILLVIDANDLNNVFAS